jgi:single-stranded-DNA-specific exonuclease
MMHHWRILTPEPADIRRLCDALGCHPVTAAVLVNRKLSRPQDAADFLNPSLGLIRPPFKIQDMSVAVERIVAAVTDRQRILVFGDYDVDGITATAILLKFLRQVEARVSYYIPDRMTEGYGLKPDHITRIAKPSQIDLIITADCGSGSREAIEAAAEAGIDVIVTDHHTISESIPRACAVINPKRADCRAGLGHLAGVGVAFALVIALRARLRQAKFWRKLPEPNLKQFCDLVALGTIADMVPLIDENRIFAKTGLELIKPDGRTGLAALLDAAGLSGQPIRAGDVAFKLAPRLNAAGRIHHATVALELLTTDQIDTARKLAQQLDRLNQQRQELEKAVLEDVLRQLDEMPDLLRCKSLVLADEHWHEGVIGIVASRITKKLHRPVILIACKNGQGKGSGRSIPGIDLFQCLSASKDRLDDFGGHSQAAGLTMPAEHIAGFRQDFESAVSTLSRPEMFIREITIDAELDFADFSDLLVDELENLVPFGTANPEPLFMTRNVRVINSRIVGGHHRRMTLCQERPGTGRQLTAIQFNIDPAREPADRFDKIAYRLQWNRWNGRKRLQLLIEETLEQLPRPGEESRKTE